MRDYDQKVFIHILAQNKWLQRSKHLLYWKSLED